MNAVQDATVLVIEDDANDRFLIERAFRKAKIANPLQMVVNGDEAIAYLSGEGRFQDRAMYPLPIMALLDLKLPRRSGIEVLKWIRPASSLPTVPVVVLTSSPDGADVKAAYQAGANSYLVKPVAFEGLHRMIESVSHFWLVLSLLPGEAES